MTVEHKDIPEDGLHEPKGASTASFDQVLHADGAGGTVWKSIHTRPTRVIIEDSITSQSFVSQELVTAGEVKQVIFGEGGTSSGGNIVVSPNGNITLQGAGHYHFDVVLSAGRTSGTGGESRMYFRVLANDQLIAPIREVGLVTDKYTIPIVYSFSGDLTSTTVFKFEMSLEQDAGGNTGLITSKPTTNPAWGEAPSSRVYVTKLGVQ